MNLYGKKLCILGIYAISDDENAVVNEDFWGKLNEVIVAIGNSREILIAVDFNSRTGKKINNLVVGPFGEEVINDTGDKLIDRCEQNSLKILDGYFKHKRIHQYTWHQDTSVHMAPTYISAHGTKIHQFTWHQHTSVHMAPRYIRAHGTKIHQYTRHQDTSVHMAPRYTGAKIYNRLHYCQTKFWFKMSRCKSIKRNDCWK